MKFMIKSILVLGTMCLFGFTSQVEAKSKDKAKSHVSKTERKEQRRAEKAERKEKKRIEKCHEKCGDLFKCEEQKPKEVIPAPEVTPPSETIQTPQQ